MLNQPVGNAHVGLPSLEAPYVSIGSAEQSVHVGWSRLGAIAGSGATGFYAIKSVLIAWGLIYLSVVGVLRYAAQVGLSARAILVHTKAFARLAYAGIIAQPFGRVMHVRGAVQQSATAAFVLAGTAVRQAVSVVAAIGEVRYAAQAVAACTGVVRLGAKAYQGVAGALRQSAACFTTAHGHLTLPAWAYAQVTAVLRLPASAVMSLAGVLRLQGLARVKMLGELANTWGHTFMTVAGLLRVAAFVGNVPLKIQQFVTNKRWYRDGDDGRTHRQ